VVEYSVWKTKKIYKDLDRTLGVVLAALALKLQHNLLCCLGLTETKVSNSQKQSG
jgi:hypothetical protein